MKVLLVFTLMVLIGFIANMVTLKVDRVTYQTGIEALINR